MAHVLIVEPNVDLRESVAAVCEAWGHEVAAIPDCRDALALLRGRTPDVVNRPTCSSSERRSTAPPTA